MAVSPQEASRHDGVLLAKPPQRIGIIVPGVFLVLAMACAIVGIRRPSYFNAAAISLAIAVLWRSWVSSFLIRLTDDELVVRSMFGGTRRVDVSQIVGVDVRPGASLTSQLLSSGAEFVVDIAGAPSVAVNAAVFNGRDLEALIAKVRALAAARRSPRTEHPEAPRPAASGPSPSS